ncbi:MAG: hypothetical protein KC416_15015, partial [Myxococcales bacterium]|nr:hypothetical protein [Myxococcales bacterium]
GDGDVAGKFSCLANVGVDGSGIEMPLRAVELAVSDRVADGTNAGFLRDDALLAVVILTDEDDCSHSTSPIKHTVPLFGSVPECMPNGLDEISHFVTTLNDIKGGPEKWAAAVIAGPAGGTRCESGFGTASPANRLQSFVDTVGDNAILSSICEGDLSKGLADAVNTFDVACRAFVK